MSNPCERNVIKKVLTSKSYELIRMEERGSTPYGGEFH